jgi:hypothetical protein
MSFEWFWVPALAADHTQFVLDPGMVALLIPITVIVFGFTAGIVKMVIQHRERMAKIGMGIDPDAPKTAAGQSADPNSHYSR